MALEACILCIVHIQYSFMFKAEKKKKVCRALIADIPFGWSKLLGYLLRKTERVLPRKVHPSLPSIQTKHFFP